MQLKLEQNYSATVIPSAHFKRYTLKYVFCTQIRFANLKFNLRNRFTENDLNIVSDDASIEFQWTHKHGGKNLSHIFTTAAQGKVIWSVNCKPQGTILFYYTRSKSFTESSQTWTASRTAGGPSGATGSATPPAAAADAASAPEVARRPNPQCSAATASATPKFQAPATDFPAEKFPMVRIFLKIKLEIKLRFR